MVRAAHGTHAKIIVLLRDPIERFHAAFWSYEQCAAAAACTASTTH